MSAVLAGICLGIVFGWLSIRFETLIFGSSGFVGFVGWAADELVEPLAMSRMGLSGGEEWRAFVAVTDLLPDPLVSACLWFFCTAIVARLGTWAYIHATFDPASERVQPECPQGRVSRIMAEYGYSEHCVRELQQKSDAFHARWRH